MPNKHKIMKMKYILSLALILIMGLGFKANGQASLSVKSQTLNAGVVSTLEIDLDNTEEVTAFQVDITLPTGVMVNTMVNEDGETVPDVQLTDRKKSKHQLTCVEQSDGSYRAIVISMSNQAFKETSGAILTMSVTPSATMSSGQYAVKLTNIHIVPLIDGEPADRIDQADYTGYITITNENQGSEENAYLSVSTTEITAGKSDQKFAIALTNDMEVTAFQFDILFSDGITINNYKNEGGETVPNVQLTSRKKSSHSLTANRRDDGSYTIVVISMQNKAFSGTSGDIVEMNLNVPSGLENQTLVTLSNIHIVPLVNGEPGARIDQSDVTQYLTVNANGSGGNENPDATMRFGIQPLELTQGASAELQVELENELEVCSFQFSIQLPKGLNVNMAVNEDEEYVENIYLDVNRKKSSHQLSVKKTDENTYFIIAYSLSNSVFNGNEGTILRLDVNADEEMEPGSYTASITDAVIVTPEEYRYEQAYGYGNVTILERNSLADTPIDALSITIVGDHIVATNLAEGDILQLYTVDGQLFAEEKANNGKAEINCEHFQGYILAVVSRNGNVVKTEKFGK